MEVGPRRLTDRPRSDPRTEVPPFYRVVPGVDPTSPGKTGVQCQESRRSHRLRGRSFWCPTFGVETGTFEGGGPPSGFRVGLGSGRRGGTPPVTVGVFSSRPYLSYTGPRPPGSVSPALTPSVPRPDSCVLRKWGSSMGPKTRVQWVPFPPTRSQGRPDHPGCVSSKELTPRGSGSSRRCLGVADGGPQRPGVGLRSLRLSEPRTGVLPHASPHLTDSAGFPPGLGRSRRVCFLTSLRSTKSWSRPTCGRRPGCRSRSVQLVIVRTQR